MASQKRRNQEKTSGKTSAVMRKNAASVSENKHPIEETIDYFLDCIEGLRAYAPVIDQILSEIYKKHVQDLEEHADKSGKVSRKKKGVKTLKFTGDRLYKARETIYEIDKITAAHKTFPSMILLPLVSQYDAFIANLLKVLFQKKPECIFSAERQVSFSEIAELNSIEDIRNSILEKEVEKIIRESHSKQFDLMEKYFGIELKKGLDVWPDFIEITERRNLLAHTNGVVSKQYLSICNHHEIAAEKIQKLGDKLSFTGQYFVHAFDVFFEISIKLSHVLWRKLQPEEIELSDNHYSVKCYDLIVAGNYEVAIKLLDFICGKEKKHSNENILLIMKFNRCNAHRLAKRQARCIELLDEIDTSALGIEFKLAEAVLRNQFDHAGKLMRQIGDRHEVIGKRCYSEWPIFEGFRESNQFLKAYEEIFGEPFTVRTSLNPDEIVESNADSTHNHQIKEGHS